MSEDKYHSASQSLLLRVVARMAAAPLDQHTLAALVSDLGGSRDQVYRALRNLEAAGWAEQRDNGWRLGAGITRISERVRVALADTHERYLGTGGRQ